jgi:superfamily II DNA/RNA helicase
MMTDLQKIEDWINNNKESIEAKELLKFIQSLKPRKDKLDFTGLHSRLQSRMKELTSKTNHKVQGKWNFIPSEKDLIDSLVKTCKKYNLTDTQKIQNLLIIHCEKAVKNDFNFLPLLGYYISKNNVSQLAADMENDEEVINQTHDGINI